MAWATATIRQASSVRCVASRSRSYRTYVSTATCTARPSMRATSVVVASAGPPPSRSIERLAPGNWRPTSKCRRTVKSLSSGVLAGCIGLSFVFDELVYCLNDHKQRTVLAGCIGLGFVFDELVYCLNDHKQRTSCYELAWFYLLIF